MIELPAYVFWSLISAPFLAGMGVITYMQQYIKRNECNAKREVCDKQNNAKFEDINENRREVWRKIDDIKEDTSAIRIKMAELMVR